MARSKPLETHDLLVKVVGNADLPQFHLIGQRQHEGEKEPVLGHAVAPVALAA